MNNEERSFTVGGKKVVLSKPRIEAALHNVTPNPIKKYFVRIGATDYPIKQVLAVATGMPVAAFVATDAYRILTRVGFEVRV